MKKYVLLYSLVHLWACVERRYMALLPLSTLFFSLLSFHYQKVHSRVGNARARRDIKRHEMLATEQVNFWCSAALSFIFLLRFLIFVYCFISMASLSLSMFGTFMQSFQGTMVDPTATFASGGSQFPFDFITNESSSDVKEPPLIRRLVAFDGFLSFLPLLFAYGFYSVQAWNITYHDLYENNPWLVRFYWAMVALLFYTPYQSVFMVLIYIYLLTHIHTYFSQLQTTLDQSEPFNHKGLIRPVVYLLERLTFVSFKVFIPGLVLLIVIGCLVVMSIANSMLSSMVPMMNSPTFSQSYGFEKNEFQTLPRII